MSNDLNNEQLGFLSDCGIVFDDMSGNQKINALVEDIKMRAVFMADTSRDYQQKQDQTLGEYLTELKHDLTRLNAAVSKLDELINNPNNWKI